MLNDELIKRLNDDEDFKEFRNWLISKIDEFDSVDGLENMSNTEAGEEAKVRAKAKAKIYEILAPIIEIRERKEPSDAEVQKAKDKRAL